MKEHTREEYEAAVVQLSAAEVNRLIARALDALHADQQRKSSDIAFRDHTFEELIDTVMAARDRLAALELEVADLDKEIERLDYVAAHG